MTKDEALAIARTTFPEYKIRWTDSRGDFEGREVTFDVFGVSVTDHKAFLRRARTIQEQFTAGLGSRCIFLFRSIPVPSELR